MIKAALGLVVLAVAGAALWDVATFDRAGWRSDYALLRHATAQRYANLDWVREHRKLDLARLDRETQAALDRAWSRVQAYRALSAFVAAFDDPHFTLARADGPAPTPASIVAGPAPARRFASCASAGYADDRSGFAPGWAKVTDWRPIGGGDADFPIAMIGDTGVLRIDSFDVARFRTACERVVRAGMDEDALRAATQGMLNRELAGALARLRAAGARLLLVDVSGNGGGGEWVDEVVALMTPRRLTRAAPLIADPPCDRSGIWEGRPDCRVLPAAGPRAEIAGKGAWRGPIAIYADRGSASATEDFTAWLRQNKVAILIGEKTLGAGCGYVNGGGRLRLAHAGLDIRMPNCARFLDDGTNEIEGQAPDIPIAANDDTSWARAMDAAIRQTRSAAR
ncbi:hypothetical protein FHS95_002406 [Sphingomonas naasensis]|uniref:S41 family peptidase n=1 Tax=Sphingomonas naasensis TaxID=1344951 RepID=UPI0014420013|nr:S41 family peptidase [Sphingomonas naasensis]NIJ20714.1 hypothetical protein [Sphingomonas naasensis]